MSELRDRDEGALRDLGWAHRARAQIRSQPHKLTVARLLNRIRARGLGEVASVGFARLREGIRSDDQLVMFVRAAEENGIPARPDLVVRRAAASDARKYAEEIGTDSATTFTARLSEDTHCYVVVRDGRFVHSSWVTLRSAWTREVRRYLKPPAGDAYLYESFTRAETRGQGIYPFALQAICADLAKQGIKRVWVAGEADNPASLRAISKAGFEEAFRLPYRRRLGRLLIERPVGTHAEIGTSFPSRTP